MIRCKNQVFDIYPFGVGLAVKPESDIPLRTAFDNGLPCKPRHQFEAEVAFCDLPPLQVVVAVRPQIRQKRIDIARLECHWHLQSLFFRHNLDKSGGMKSLQVLPRRFIAEERPGDRIGYRLRRREIQKDARAGRRIAHLMADHEYIVYVILSPKILRAVIAKTLPDDFSTERLFNIKSDLWSEQEREIGLA